MNRSIDFLNSTLLFFLSLISALFFTTFIRRFLSERAKKLYKPAILHIKAIFIASPKPVHY